MKKTNIEIDLQIMRLMYNRYRKKFISTQKELEEFETGAFSATDEQYDNFTEKMMRFQRYMNYYDDLIRSRKKEIRSKKKKKMINFSKLDKELGELMNKGIDIPYTMLPEFKAACDKFAEEMKLITAEINKKAAANKEKESKRPNKQLKKEDVKSQSQITNDADKEDHGIIEDLNDFETFIKAYKQQVGLYGDTSDDDEYSKGCIDELY